MSNHRLNPARAVPVVGMVGAGQLARMTQQAAVDLGLGLVVLARGPDEPAAQAGARVLLGEPDDPAALDRLAAGVDVVTFDHELVPSPLAVALAGRGRAVRPRGEALLYAQDKLLARRRFAEAGLPVPAFEALGEDPVGDVARFAAGTGWPVVVKTRTGGYDGRGVGVVADRIEARAFVERVGPAGLLVEEHVDLAAEAALVGVRSASGAWTAYPLVETHQVDGICRELLMPARLSAAVATEAEALARAIAEAIDAVGIIAVELFVTPEERLIVNEIALRPHNSGHATIEAAATSQFENHLRAILDWPLGDTALRAPAAAMVNILGGPDGVDPRTRLGEALAVKAAAVHLYGKAPRPGRKVGHVTALGQDAAQALEAARRCAALLGG
jgi:5-(carboxyamino)imidazole ribonucleotide synthase